MSERRVQATVPEPYEDVPSLYRSVVALKELTEMLAGQRGAEEDRAVTVGEMPVTTAGDQLWHPFAYVNGWVDYGAPFSPSGFRKLSSGLVILRGLIKSGTAAHMLTLPPGYRPGIRMLHGVMTSPNNACRIDIAQDGAVTHTGGDPGWISMGNIAFLAEY